MEKQLCKRLEALQKEKESRELDSFYADSWEQVAQIRADIKQIDDEILEVEKLLQKEVVSMTSTKGTCSSCGCTWNKACFTEEEGACWWVDDTETICSHCYYGFTHHAPMAK
ncbi:TPA: hypothetical protein U1045_001557 [Streptococcus suis]|nr:hypothetical protein [Streptococcus suis]